MLYLFPSPLLATSPMCPSNVHLAAGLAAALPAAKASTHTPSRKTQWKHVQPMQAPAAACDHSRSAASTPLVSHSTRASLTNHLSSTHTPYRHTLAHTTARAAQPATPPETCERDQQFNSAMAKKPKFPSPRHRLDRKGRRMLAACSDWPNSGERIPT